MQHLCTTMEVMEALEMCVKYLNGAYGQVEYYSTRVCVCVCEGYHKNSELRGTLRLQFCVNMCKGGLFCVQYRANSV